MKKAREWLHSFANKFHACGLAGHGCEELLDKSLKELKELMPSKPDLRNIISKEIYSCLGSCNCSPEYKDRGLRDPRCQRCDNPEIVEDVLNGVHKLINERLV